jgi:ribonuclease D
LIDLRETLGRKLTNLGRERWVYEECSHLSDPDTFRKHPPEKCFLKIKGRKALDERGLSILRSLAHWRDLEARSRNHPSNRVVPDHVLLSIAKSVPTCVEELHHQRGLHANEVNRCGHEIIRAIRKGIEQALVDPVALPPPERPNMDDEDEGVFKILSAVLQIQAEKARIAPTVLATSHELRTLLVKFRQSYAQHRRREMDHSLPILTGWRREIAGEKLLKVLEGKLALRYNPDKNRLVIDEVELSA